MSRYSYCAQTGFLLNEDAEQIASSAHECLALLNALAAELELFKSFYDHADYLLERTDSLSDGDKFKSLREVVAKIEESRNYEVGKAAL